MAQINARDLQNFAKSSPRTASTATEGDDDEGEDDDTVTEGDDRLAVLRPILEMFAEDIATLYTNLTPEMLEDSTIPLTQADRDVLAEQIDVDLDAQFLEALKATPDLTSEEALSLGQELESEGLALDGELIGAWLFRVATYLQDASDTDEDGELPDDEELDDELE